MFTQHDFILNGDGLDFVHLHMKQGGNQTFENAIISLQKCPEKKIVL